MDAIFWNCDISVGAMGNICFFGFSQPVHGKDQFPHKISNGYQHNTFFISQGRCNYQRWKTGKEWQALLACNDLPRTLRLISSN